MRKFVPVGIAAFGIVGFLGMSAPAASADTPSQQVCAAIKSAQTAESNKTLTDINNQQVDIQDAASQTSRVANDSVIFGAAYNTYINAVMNGGPTAGPLQTLKNAIAALQNDLVAYQSSQTTLNNINTTVNLDGVITTLLDDWKAALTQPACV
ncbi:MAG: hypothetical protein M3256_26175 [Actinomycetota bacterium]|nr:hypothetical protein [Actinomycetota bacterium]